MCDGTIIRFDLTEKELKQIIRFMDLAKNGMSVCINDLGILNDLKEKLISQAVNNRKNDRNENG